MISKNSFRKIFIFGASQEICSNFTIRMVSSPQRSCLSNTLWICLWRRSCFLRKLNNFWIYSKAMTTLVAKENVYDNCNVNKNIILNEKSSEIEDAIMINLFSNRNYNIIELSSCTLPCCTKITMKNILSFWFFSIFFLVLFFPYFSLFTSKKNNKSVIYLVGILK